MNIKKIIRGRKEVQMNGNKNEKKEGRILETNGKDELWRERKMNERINSSKLSLFVPLTKLLIRTAWPFNSVQTNNNIFENF